MSLLGSSLIKGNLSFTLTLTQSLYSSSWWTSLTNWFPLAFHSTDYHFAFIWIRSLGWYALDSDLTLTQLLITQTYLKSHSQSHSTLTPIQLSLSLSFDSQSPLTLNIHWLAMSLSFKSNLTPSLNLASNTGLCVTWSLHFCEGFSTFRITITGSGVFVVTSWRRSLLAQSQGDILVQVSFWTVFIKLKDMGPSVFLD